LAYDRARRRGGPSNRIDQELPAPDAERLSWSAFAYDARTRTFIANSMKGRELSSLDKLVKYPDGSIDIYIGPTAPKGLESNWIETIPGIDVFMGLRTYGPEKAVLDGTYKIPRFELMK
jgi:hypothetical protein